MIQTNPLSGPEALIRSIDALIARHGAARVLAAALGAMLTRRREPRRAPPDAEALSAHLRRDIGLPPVARPPPRWQLPL